MTRTTVSLENGNNEVLADKEATMTEQVGIRSKGRIEYIDIAKGIGILAIVIGHMGFSELPGSQYIVPLFFQFHVPIFFLIAGYFLSQKQNVLTFIASKARRMLLPYLFCCVVIALILLLYLSLFGSTQPPSIYPNISSFLFAAIYGSGGGGNPSPPGIIHIGAIWFLQALFVALVEVRVLIALKKWAFIPIVIFAVASSLSSRYFWLPFNIQSGLCGGLYVYVGYIAKKYDALLRTPSPVFIMILVVFCILGVKNNIWVDLCGASFGTAYLGLPLSISTSYLVIRLSSWIRYSIPSLASILVFFGKNSLVVLCFHLILLDVGIIHLTSLAPLIPGYDLPCMLDLALTILISICGAQLVGRIPLLRVVFR